MGGKTDKMRLTVGEIEECLENIEGWVRFVREALASFDETTATATVVSGSGGISLPPRLAGCPPPETTDEEGDRKGPKKPKKPKKDETCDDEKDEKKKNKKKKDKKKNK